MSRDLVVLRYTDLDEERLLAVCRHVAGVGTFRAILSEEDAELLAWMDHPDKPAVILDTTGPVFVTSSAEMMTMSVWFGLAAEWLRRTEESSTEEQDNEWDDL